MKGKKVLKKNRKAEGNFKALAFLAVIALVAVSAYYAGTASGNREILKDVQKDISGIQTDVSSLQNKLAETEKNISVFQENLSGSSTRFDNLEKGLCSDQSKPSEMEVNLVDTSSEPANKTSASREKPRNFESLIELYNFLKEDDTDERQYVPVTFDCDDFAITLQQRALEKGYIMNAQYTPGHLSNLVVIGNSIYRVEPQNDKVFFLSSLD